MSYKHSNKFKRATEQNNNSIFHVSSPNTQQRTRCSYIFKRDVDARIISNKGIEKYYIEKTLLYSFMKSLPWRKNINISTYVHVKNGGETTNKPWILVYSRVCVHGNGFLYHIENSEKNQDKNVEVFRTFTYYYSILII